MQAAHPQSRIVRIGISLETPVEAWIASVLTALETQTELIFAWRATEHAGMDVGSDQHSTEGNLR